MCINNFAFIYFPGVDVCQTAVLLFRKFVREKYISAEVLKVARMGSTISCKCWTPVEKSNFCPLPVSMLNELQRGFFHADPGKE